MGLFKKKTKIITKRQVNKNALFKEVQDNKNATFETSQLNEGAIFHYFQTNRKATFKYLQDNRDATFEGPQYNNNAKFLDGLFIYNIKLPKADKRVQKVLEEFSKDYPQDDRRSYMSSRREATLENLIKYLKGWE